MDHFFSLNSGALFIADTGAFYIADDIYKAIKQVAPKIIKTQDFRNLRKMM